MAPASRDRRRLRRQLEITVLGRDPNRDLVGEQHKARATKERERGAQLGMVLVLAALQEILLALSEELRHGDEQHDARGKRERRSDAERAKARAHAQRDRFARHGDGSAGQRGEARRDREPPRELHVGSGHGASVLLRLRSPVRMVFTPSKFLPP